MAKKEITSVGDILAGLSHRGELAVRLRHALIWRHWDAIVGDELARFGAALGLRDGTLYVEVAGPVFMHRYAYAKQKILDGIEAATGAHDVEDLFIRLKYED